MNEIFLKIVTFLHVLLILFIIIIPFTNYNYLLLLHAIIVPFIMFHWILNDNTCILTIIEKHLRKQIYGETAKAEDCFTCRLIEPIYDFANNYDTLSKIIYVVTFSLWLFGVYRLYSKYQSGEIKSFYELFTQ
jgi:hypothetical protein